MGRTTDPIDPRLVATCLPVQKTDEAGNPVVDKQGNPVYETNDDGTRVCDPNTVAERVKAYREENHLSKTTPVPVDAVTASGSGLDPDITVANAKLQAPRVAQARRLPLAKVSGLDQGQHRRAGARHPRRAGSERARAEPCARRCQALTGSSASIWRSGTNRTPSPGWVRK